MPALRLSHLAVTKTARGLHLRTLLHKRRKLVIVAGMSKPTGQRSVRVHVMMTPSELRSIDDWRRHQPALPSRAAAIRTLIRRGLAAKVPAKAIPAKTRPGDHD
jgi:hypothetical protein